MKILQIIFIFFIVLICISPSFTLSQNKKSSLTLLDKKNGFRGHKFGLSRKSFTNLKKFPSENYFEPDINISCFDSKDNLSMFGYPVDVIVYC